MSGSAKMTPFMAQYQEVKRRHPDHLVLFRMGDFYETFFEDARTASRILGLALTSRDSREAERTPMAGLPWHALDDYLPRLIKAGVRVAICDQVEDPAKAKGLVRREVVRVVTGGTLTEDKLLEPGRSNYLAAVQVEGADCALAWLDYSTGEVCTRLAPKDRLLDLLEAVRPGELVAPRSFDLDPLLAELRLAHEGLSVAFLDEWVFGRKAGAEAVMRVYGVPTLDGLGIPRESPALGPLGALLKYLEDTQFTSRLHLRRVRSIPSARHMILDRQTCRNLEIFQNQQDGGRAGTLFGCLDRTATPMGARKLAAWLASPLLDRAELERRLDLVQAFAELPAREEFAAAMGELRDLERPLGRVRCGRYSARDLKSIELSLRVIPRLNSVLAASPVLAAAVVPELADTALDIGRTLRDELPLATNEGGMIRPGHHAELDALRAVAAGGLGYLHDLEERLKAEFALPGLKVRHNKVFGYYIELPKAQSARAPAHFTRKQTLVGAERYTIPELKEHEDTVFGAEARIAELELALLGELRERVLAAGEPLLDAASRLAELDVLSAFAGLAVQHAYSRPRIVEEPAVTLERARHPVVERLLPLGGFCPNDLDLGAAGTRLVLLTGPNMAGKSTYIRQVGLIQIMAQVGSFVPAAAAALSLKDRVFTRVGAGDDLGSGRSTFMVEMNETANILHNATPRSLVILDEVGRGTSTLDGLSLAWAIAEELHDNAALAPLTLFATHYHELTDLSARCPRMANFHVAVREEADGVTFLHAIRPGSTDRSYGIHVARLAGIPERVVSRAWEILGHLEEDESRRTGAPPPPRSQREPEPLFRFDEALTGIRRRLASVDPDGITPLQALMILRELKDMDRT